jgi:hypothetical protein
MILVLLIAGSALALAVLACVAVDSPIPIGDAGAILVGAPFPVVPESAPPLWQRSIGLLRGVSQFIEESSCISEIRIIKTFGEPGIDR